MKEANISNGVSETSQSSTITETMFTQIGKLYMELVNSGKIIENLSKQDVVHQQQAEQKLNEYKVSVEQKIQEADNIKASSDNKVISISERLKKLEESNQLYQKNNKELADKIQKLSETVKIKNTEIKELKKKPIRRKRTE